MRVGMVRDHTNVRYRIIELLSYWEGLVNTTQLMQHFSVSRTQAQKYFKSYQADYPDNLIYDNSLKGFRPSGDVHLTLHKQECGRIFRLVK
ncbi:hypothetical protein [uncultured Paraglaciecola sp.]|uniref:hypothetical protein n=1 Tax=uncultured Paraglaciecola sp. TaxID=1765024 RepID=UPI002611C4BB|nr:hypothetical protein [uncultured Paraglaciecola sp.]